MVLAQNKHILNFLISNNSIKNVQELPNIKSLTIKIFYKKKTVYLIMTTFLIFFFLTSKKPKLSTLKIFFLTLKKKHCFKFLYNFYWLFFKYNNLHFSYFRLKTYNKNNIRLFFYTLQNIFFELFFFKMIQFGNWENLIFKLELLFKMFCKKKKKLNLIFFFKGFKLL